MKFLIWVFVCFPFGHKPRAKAAGHKPGDTTTCRRCGYELTLDESHEWHVDWRPNGEMD